MVGFLLGETCYSERNKTIETISKNLANELLLK